MDKKISLAPMSGVTDLAFRLISRKFGAKHCFFEMLDSMAVLSNYKKTKRRIKTIRKDSPISCQLLGSDPSMMLDAAQRIIQETPISSLDINSACPAKKVLKKHAGAMLLKDSKNLGRIIKKLRDHLKIPVTVKLRTGIDKCDIEKLKEIARICQANGASLLYVHGRTVNQGYSGDIDYESIKAVKDVVTIPVFGSGNILDHIMAKKMIDKTGCDGILVARGALGNPWIFKDIEEYLNKGRINKKPSLAQKKKILKKHLSYIEKYKDISPANKMGFMGKVCMWYLKGTYKATKTRALITKAKSPRELYRIIKLIN